jgi:hypothetical protein
MKINTLLSVFAPKDVKFFPLLDEATSILVQSSVLLKDSSLQKIRNAEMNYVA